MNTNLLNWFGLGFLRFFATIHACNWIIEKLNNQSEENYYITSKVSLYATRDYIFTKKFKKTVIKPKIIIKKLFTWPYQLITFIKNSSCLIISSFWRNKSSKNSNRLPYRIYLHNLASGLFLGADVVYFYVFLLCTKTGSFQLYHFGPVNTIIKFIRIGFISRYNWLSYINHDSVYPSWTWNSTVLPFLQLFYAFFKKGLVALIISGTFVLFSFSLFQVSLVKLVANWIIILLFAFWLISGFNFFLKRYRYGKYTSSLQRFWKRAFMCFWMIEGFLFILFFYYFLNSSAEPVFMYDQNQLYLRQLNSWNSFVLTATFFVFIINLLLVLILVIKNRSSKVSAVILSIITLFLVTILLFESYQFYYIVNFYDDSIWTFSEEDNLWELEHDISRTRTKNHFTTLCILAKFWHFIFIFIVWVFCIMKFFELGKLSYNLISVNYQNIIILYIMNWLFMIDWIKWLLHRFFETAYFWFFTDNRSFIAKLLAYDILSLFSNSAASLLNKMHFFKRDYYSAFYYFNISSRFSFDRTTNLSLYFLKNAW